MDGDGRTGGRSHPRAGHGRGPEGWVRPSGHGDEPGARRLPAVPAHTQARSSRPALAGQGQVRAFLRAFQPDFVYPALSVRLWAHAGRPRGAAHLGQPHARSSRAPPDAGRRDDDGAARPGPGQRRRHGDGGPPRARAARPGRAGRAEPVRPPHLRVRLGRRHRGGRQPRGLLAGRAPAARQPGAAVRRQRHLDRGRHDDRQVRGRAGQVRRLRLAHPAGQLAHPRGLPRGRRGAVRGAARRARPHRGAVDHRAVHDHRLAGAEQAEHRRGARLGARRARGRGHQADPRLRPGRDVPGRGRGGRQGPRGRRPRQGGAGRSGTSASPPGPRPARPGARCSTGWPPVRCRRAGPTRSRSSAPTRARWRRGRPPARC